MSLLHMRGVTKSYNRGGFFSRKETHHVLRGIDLDIAEGECVGLVGRSGCGKSSLGRIVLGLERPDSGRAQLQGKDLTDKTKMPKDIRRSVQVVFQDALASVNPRWTAGRIIAEPLRNFENLQGAPLRKRIVELLKLVGLSAEDVDKHPQRFSGGQLQRVCIARALAASPRLIVLDEAVSSLDMLVQSRILDLFESLRATSGTAFLFITHDLRLVRRLCDRALLLDEGVLTAFDPKLKERTRLPAGLLPLLDAVLPAMPEGRS